MSAEVWTVPDDSYHADQANSISHSDLEVFRCSPRLYQGRFLTGEFKRESTKALEFGDIFHEIILAPQLTQRYCIIPSTVLNDQGHRKGKAWLDYQAANDGKYLFKDSEFLPAEKLIANIRARERACQFLFDDPGQNEIAIRFDIPELGFIGRCKLDRLLERLIVDVKTTNDASPRAFAKTAFDRGYHRQAAWYQDAVEALRGERLPFVFIACEKVEPYSVRVYELSPEFLAIGAEENEADLRRFAEAKRLNVWDDENADTILELSPPGYAKFANQWEFRSTE